MQKQTLQASPRTILGRNVKTLRTQGVLPATLYGKSIQSQSIQIDAGTFIKVFATAGETGIVELALDGKTYPTIIHNVQYHPITSAPLHADFFNVNLKEKITAHVPLQIAGESPAVKDKLGSLLTMLNEIEVEALPTNLPDHITVDIASLSEVDQSIKVKDLKTPAAVKILTDGEQDVVKIAPLVSKEAEKMAVEETLAAQAQTEEAKTDEKQEAPSEASSQKPAEEKTS